MTIRLEILADHVTELLADLENIAAALRSETAPAVDRTVDANDVGEPDKDKPKEKKSKPKKDVEKTDTSDEVKDEEVEDVEGETKPEEPAYDRAVALLIDVYERKETRGDVRDLLKKLDVKTFNDVDPSDGENLLEEARKIAKKYNIEEAA